MSFLGSIFGDKPEIAPYTPTEFGPEQIKALKENVAAFPWISQLGSLYQQYMTGAMEKLIPGFSDILATGGKLTQQMQATAGEELAGKIPQDVLDQVYRSSAFQNLMSGGGGTMASANTARNLGLTSLDLIGKGAQLQETAGNAAQRWAGLASGMIMSPSGFLVTPSQQVELTMANRLHQQATEQLRKNVAAAPDPALQALNQWVQQVGGTVVASYLGGGGGMGGGGNYKTSYNANDYLGGGGYKTDATNPGHYVTGGGGGGGGQPPDLSASPSFASGAWPYQGSASLDTGNVDLWSSYNATPGYTPFGFGGGGGDSSLALNAMGGTTDFWNTSGVPAGTTPFGFGG